MVGPGCTILGYPLVWRDKDPNTVLGEIIDPAQMSESERWSES